MDDKVPVQTLCDRFPEIQNFVAVEGADASNRYADGKPAANVEHQALLGFEHYASKCDNIRLRRKLGVIRILDRVN